MFHNQAAGGAKRVIFEHARRLRERGHTLDAYVLTTATEEYLPLAPLCEHVYTYDVPAAPRRRPPRHYPLLRKALRALGGRVGDAAAHLEAVTAHATELAAVNEAYEGMAFDLNRRGYDVAYVHQCRTSISPGLLRQLACPSVYFCHDTLRYVHDWAFEEHQQYDALPDTWYWHKMRGNLVPLPMMRFLNDLEQQYVAATRAATVVLCNSWFSREAIMRTTGTNPRVCYPGVDADYFCPDPGVARESVVLSVGTLAANKRHDFVLEAIATIPAERRPAMDVVGYEAAYGEAEFGPYARRLQALAAERGVTLRIYKEVSDSLLRDRYRRAAVFAFAPALEPFGIVPLEAMACGTPVVGVSEGGLRETIQDDVTGLLTERDHVAFGAALDRVVADRALAAAMGQRGREDAVSRWSWDRSTDRLEEQLQAARGTARVSAVLEANRIRYGRGFYPEESNGQGPSWRWMGPVGVVDVRTARGDMVLTIGGRAPAWSQERPTTLTLQFNGRSLDRIVMTEETVHKVYEISALRQGERDWSQLRLRIDRTLVPGQGDPRSEDRRRLGFALHHLSWEPK